MERKFYPLYYAGKKQRFARSVVVGDIVFLSGSSGRTMETGGCGVGGSNCTFRWFVNSFRISKNSCADSERG